MTSGIDPETNTRAIAEAARDAKQGGARILFTPEMAGMLDRQRSRAALKVVREDESEVLAALRETARREALMLHIGSLAIARQDGRWANRSFVIDDGGEIVARYDKMHMFDVDLADGESWRESNTYAPGDKVVTVETPAGKLGLAICYDLRFPALFDALGQARCDLLALPAAFTVPTGEAHWHVLLRARAIEASAWLVAPAQVGEHEDGRKTYGHSLVIDPWGRVVLDMGSEGPGLGFADIDPEATEQARAQVPSLANRRPITTSFA